MCACASCTVQGILGRFLDLYASAKAENAEEAAAAAAEEKKAKEAKTPEKPNGAADAVCEPAQMGMLDQMLGQTKDKADFKAALQARKALNADMAGALAKRGLKAA